MHQSSPLGPQGSTASDSVSRSLEHPRVELCWQWNRSTYLFLAAAGFDFLARTALAAIVASSFGSQLAGGCRHVLRKLSIEREESTYWFRYRSMSGSGTDHAADVERVGKNLIYQIDGDQGLFNPFRRLEFSFKPGGTQLSEHHISSIGSHIIATARVCGILFVDTELFWNKESSSGVNVTGMQMESLTPYVLPKLASPIQFVVSLNHLLRSIAKNRT